MAETAKMNSQLSTSYSTSYTLWGLSRRYLALFTREGLPLRPCIQALDFEILASRSQKIVAGKGVPKCLTFDVDSIFEVEILSENFSHYTDPRGT